ncbi:MAG: caspase family protein [Saprospiraceae bacterium]|nr:caspase family protein [Saprospiraceae bacterium]
MGNLNANTDLQYFIHECWWKWIAVLYLGLILHPAMAQEKGNTGLILDEQNNSRGTTRAVVVGISNYQHPDIPDLRFADRDATIFVKYLQSSAGGSLALEHIRLLVDSMATNARFESELTWLLEESQPGDQAIIYFSGHGDVEQKYGNTGFLLCHDASPRLYGSTGAFSVYHLKLLIQSFSEKRVKVILITDACRAGKLAGSPIGGPYLTAAAMKEQFANEIKLMACQPNEMSLESPSLGNGRGVFSYYLIRGLLGESDEEDDHNVKLGELNRYLTYHVSKEVSPLYQNPQISGDAEATLSVVDSTVQNNQLVQDNNNLEILSYYCERGYEEAYINRLDTAQQTLIATFNSLVREKAFFDPADHCADRYYEMIQSDPLIPSEFKRYIKRHYAVALQDDIQQALLAIMDANLTSGPETRIMVNTYRDYPRQIARSAEILGSHHIMYKNLKAREKWLEGFLLYGDNEMSNDPAIGRRILNFFDASLALEENSPVVHYYKALAYINIMQMQDSTLEQVHLANAKAMNWNLPNTHIATLLIKKPYFEFDIANKLLFEASEMDSTSVLVWRGLGTLYYYQKKYVEAEANFRRALAQDSTNGISWSNLAAVISTPSRYQEAEHILKEGISKCPDIANLRYVYGCILSNTNRIDDAIRLYNESKKINPQYKPTRDSLVVLYLQTGQTDLAIQELNALIQQNSNDYTAYFRLAQIYLKQNKIDRTILNIEAYFIALKSTKRNPGIDPRIIEFEHIPELKILILKYTQTEDDHE